MNREERRELKARGIKLNACRQIDGVFEDGMERFVWTLPDGSAMLHSHDEDVCPFGPNGKHANRAEVTVLSMLDRGCDECAEHGDHGPASTFEGLFGFTEEQSFAVFDWYQVEDEDSPEFEDAVQNLKDLGLSSQRASDILDVMFDKGLIVGMCAKHKAS